MTTDPSLLLAHHAPAQRSRSSRNSSSSSSSSSTTSSILLWLILFIALLTLGGLGYYASLLDFTYYRAVDEMSRTIPRKQDYVVSSWKGGAVQKKNIGAAIRTTQTTTSTLQQTRPLHRDAAIPSSSANKAPTTTTTTTTSSSSSASSSSTTKSTTSSNSPHYHMVFSTSCSPQQDWESFVFFYHAYKVQQSGSVVRQTKSGCCGGECVPRNCFLGGVKKKEKPEFVVFSCFSRLASLRVARNHKNKICKPFTPHTFNPCPPRFICI